MRIAAFSTLFIALIAQLSACNLSIKEKADSTKINEDDVKVAEQLFVQNVRLTSPFLQDTSYSVNCMGKPIEVRFVVAKNVKDVQRKLLLLLPGWNYSDTQWCTRTQVCSQAQKFGYDLMFVEMGKSVYMDSLYPEMRKDYRLYPTRTWLWDSVAKPLMLRGYFTRKIPTFAMGLSTGGRGAMLLGIEHPGAFKAVASLSGDYNPAANQADNLMINCLGKYSNFSWRWNGSNNIQLRLNELKIPCYIAHGESDLVVSVKQAEQLYSAHEILRHASANGSKLGQMKLSIVKNAAHDYKFWGERGILAINFFEDILKNSTLVK